MLNACTLLSLFFALQVCWSFRPSYRAKDVAPLFFGSRGSRTTVSVVWSASSTKNQVSTENNNQKPATAIVIGAGLAGLALSLGIAQRTNYTVHLVERQATIFARRGATFGLRPSGIKALDELDPTIMPDLHRVGIGTAEKGYMMPWFVLRDALLQRVQERTSQICLHMGWEIQDIVQMDRNNDTDYDDVASSSVKATFLDADGQPVCLEGSFLIGCDGVNSTVRHLLGLPPAISGGSRFWRGSLQVPTSSSLANNTTNHLLDVLHHYNYATVYQLPSVGAVLSIFNFHSGNPNTLAWAVSIKNDGIAAGAHPWTALRNATDPFMVDNRQMLQQLFDYTDEYDLTHLWDVRTIDPHSVESWGSDRCVLLLGDAAHAIRPVSGIGGSLAFEDCVAFCRELDWVVQMAQQQSGSLLPSPNDIAQAIQNTIEIRQPRVKKVWQTEWDLAESFYKNKPPVMPTKEYEEWLNAGI